MDFPGVLKKHYVNVEYQGCSRKNKEFPRGVTLSEISGGSFLLSIISKSEVTNLETPRFF